MVGLALRIRTGRDDANRLPFQQRERHAAHVQHDVMGFVFSTGLVDLHIAHHRGRHWRLGAMQIGVRVRRRPGGHGGAPTARLEARSLTRRSRNRSGRRAGGCGRCHGFIGGSACGVQGVFRQRRRQLIPQQLLLDRVSLGLGHAAPVVDRPRRARRHAGHAQVADIGLDHVIP